MGKMWKVWLAAIAIGFVIAAALYVGSFIGQTVQDGDVTLSRVPAALVLVAVLAVLSYVFSSYWREIFVAVVGMVVGAVVGIFPYLILAIFLLLLGLSPEDKAGTEELRQLFNSQLFNELFFVAGAASGGPIAILVYFKRQKRESAEGGEGR